MTSHSFLPFDSTDVLCTSRICNY